MGMDSSSGTAKSHEPAHYPLGSGIRQAEESLRTSSDPFRWRLMRGRHPDCLGQASGIVALPSNREQIGFFTIDFSIPRCYVSFFR